MPADSPNEDPGLTGVSKTEANPVPELSGFARAERRLTASRTAGMGFALALMGSVASGSADLQHSTGNEAATIPGKALEQAVDVNGSGRITLDLPFRTAVTHSDHGSGSQKPTKYKIPTTR